MGKSRNSVITLLSNWFKKLNIRTKLIVSFLLIALIPFLVTGYISYTYMRYALMREAIDHLISIAERQAYRIEAYFHEKEVDATTLSKSLIIPSALNNLSNAIQSGIDSSTYQEASKDIHRFLTFYLNAGNYANMYLISANGQIVDSVRNEGNLGADLRSNENKESDLAKVFDRATTLLDTQISNFAYDPVLNQPVAFIAAPIFREDSIVGAVVLQLNNEEVYRVVNDYTGLKESGETLIASLFGDYIIYVTPTRHDPQAAFQRKINVKEARGSFLERIITGHSEIGITKDYRGEEVLAVGKYFLPGLGWAMIVKVDTNEIFGPIQRLRDLALLMALLTSVAVVITAIAIARSIADPIISLTEKTNLIAAGAISQSIEVSSQDEVGHLASSFNFMTGRVKEVIENLDRLVNERTRELERKNEELSNALKELKAAQERLVYQEKLAFLGDLTAGIAHEIKNPLNFVNNFSDLALEIAIDLESSLKKRVSFLPEEEESFNTLKNNLHSVLEQGKRADNIVQRMLGHARRGKGLITPTNIHSLIDESVKLSYHAARAQNTDFNVTFEKEFDPDMPDILIVAEDISRVFLNLLNNAYYALLEKKRNLGENYKPILSITTGRFEDFCEIRIRDNGTGIPPDIEKKIFSPFFTTKPTGQGTGLGLSLSYNIVVQGHQGTLNFYTEPGEFTEFIIRLPINRKT